MWVPSQALRGGTHLPAQLDARAPQRQRRDIAPLSKTKLEHRRNARAHWSRLSGCGRCPSRLGIAGVKLCCNGCGCRPQCRENLGQFDFRSGESRERTGKVSERLNLVIRLQSSMLTTVSHNVRRGASWNPHHSRSAQQKLIGRWEIFRSMDFLRILSRGELMKVSSIRWEIRMMYFFPSMERTRSGVEKASNKGR